MEELILGQIDDVYFRILNSLLKKSKQSMYTQISGKNFWVLNIAKLNPKITDAPYRLFMVNQDNTADFGEHRFSQEQADKVKITVFI